MVLNETGNYRYDGYGFGSVDAAKARIEELKKNIPDYLRNAIDNESVSIDVKTGRISAHISASQYDGEI